MSKANKVKILIILSLLMLGTSITEVFAHQPRIVEERTTNIKNPEISQAFYTKLEGSEKLFIIENEENFNLYAQLTVADLENSKTDYYFRIEKYDYDNLELVAEVNGANYEWKSFYEEFAGDHYLLGPEYENSNASGKYLITLGSNDGFGEVILVTGKIESFPLSEIANIYKVLPEIKKEFFDKPSISAYTNKTSLFVLLPFIFILSLLILFFVFKKRIKKKVTTT